MSRFDDLSLEARMRLQREFEKSTTTRERRIQMLTLLQEGADEAKMSRPCPRCRHHPFFASHDEALIEGHVYSNDGIAELRITGYCEWCFDLVTAEPEDEEDND